MNAKLRKFTEVGSSSTSDSSNTRRAELSVAVYVGENGYVQNAGFVHQPIAALEKRAMTGPVAIILHRTDGASVQSALNSANSGIGTHFYVDKDGTVYQTASLHKHTSHVGRIRSRCYEASNCPADEMEEIRGFGWAPKRLHDHEKGKPYPTRYPMNEDSVGIETVSRCVKNCGPNDKGTPEWETPTAEQAESIANIISILQDAYSLTDTDIYEHDLISYKTAGEGAGLWNASGDE
ncbi:peptidoglycan recognition protein family protein [Luteimonas terrae]|uniref:N-acetyl-anhydromuramyl-L-alanine amidase AmpD n=1 Tax=Luteimonas terrae TaxID=1530191 RepID=A0ABU1Y0H2_9GAMM|nr:N-acetylmuramoyl-L-alanine amidase [Luteimonas terrae]MDR7194521.1 N-acetyl-anhydromuramyl-L-alanine amidase AmpD [Luteimonas terrae]